VDTSSSQGRLLSTLFAAIAEFERDLIRERTGETLAEIAKSYAVDTSMISRLKA
jgi:DNA invertase Pin-like site-specific DNA recombinase